MIMHNTQPGCTSNIVKHLCDEAHLVASKTTLISITYMLLLLR